MTSSGMGQVDAFTLSEAATDAVRLNCERLRLLLNPSEFTSDAFEAL